MFDDLKFEITLNKDTEDEKTISFTAIVQTIIAFVLDILKFEFGFELEA